MKSAAWRVNRSSIPDRCLAVRGNLKWIERTPQRLYPRGRIGRRLNGAVLTQFRCMQVYRGLLLGVNIFNHHATLGAKRARARRVVAAIDRFETVDEYLVKTLMHLNRKHFSFRISISGYSMSAWFRSVAACSIPFSAEDRSGMVRRRVLSSCNAVQGGNLGLKLFLRFAQGGIDPLALGY